MTREVETFMPEGMGVWYLRYVDTGETVPDRGPYLAHKSALKGARSMNGQPADVPAEEPAAPIPEAPKPAPKASKAKAKAKVKPAPEAPAEDWTAPPTEAAPDLAPVVSSVERHAWIEDAAQFALEIVAKAGGNVHDRIRVTLGWPFMSGRKALGECWSDEASTDGVREIFVSPTIADGSRIVDVLIHELCHACLPFGEKHGKNFKTLATACGLTGKMTATVASPELQTLIAEWIEKRGMYPAGALDPLNSGRKKQSTRLVKAECGTCGYTMRVTRKWIEKAHPCCPDPDCPSHDEPMQVDGVEPGGEED